MTMTALWIPMKANPDKLGDNNGQNYIQKLTDFSWTGS